MYLFIKFGIKIEKLTNPMRTQWLVQDSVQMEASASVALFWLEIVWSSPIFFSLSCRHNIDSSLTPAPSPCSYPTRVSLTSDNYFHCYLVPQKRLLIQRLRLRFWQWRLVRLYRNVIHRVLSCLSFWGFFFFWDFLSIQTRN